MKSLPILHEERLAPHSQELLRETWTEDGRRRYCTQPFALLGLASDIVKPCTWLRQQVGVNVVRTTDTDNDLDRAWRSGPFNRVRRSIARGEYLHCNLEFCPEYRGDQRKFSTLEELELEQPQIAEFIRDETAEFAGGPELVNIAHDTGCNLACPSCNRLELPKLSNDVIAELTRSLPKLARDVRYIFLAGMGDPFGTPHYYEWLLHNDFSKFPKLERIILNTNALLWTPERWNALPDATRRLIRTAIISIDGASKATFEANRYPAQWETMKQRLEFISRLRRERELEHLRAYFVFQANNYREMPEMVRFCREHHFDSVFFARLTPWRGTQSEYATVDVLNPQHPAHSDFWGVAIRTTLMGGDDLEVTIMR